MNSDTNSREFKDALDNYITRSPPEADDIILPKQLTKDSFNHCIFREDYKYIIISALNLFQKRIKKEKYITKRKIDIILTSCFPILEEK